MTAAVSWNCRSTIILCDCKSGRLQTHTSNLRPIEVMKVTGLSICGHLNFPQEAYNKWRYSKGWAVLSKCANPECSEQFRYLHEGKVFCLIPTPEVAATSYGSLEFLYERFWLCDRCAKEMKVIWDGVRAKVVRLTAGDPPLPPSPETEARSGKPAALAVPGHG